MVFRAGVIGLGPAPHAGDADQEGWSEPCSQRLPLPDEAAYHVFSVVAPVGRAITYTTYSDQRQAASAHLTAAEAAVRIDASQQLVLNLADEVWQMALSGQNPDKLYRQRARGNGGFSTELAHQAVQMVTAESGASSTRSDCLTQLVFRDMQALSMRAVLNVTSMLESYGRVLLGLEPVTTFE